MQRVLRPGFHKWSYGISSFGLISVSNGGYEASLEAALEFYGNILEVVLLTKITETLPNLYRTRVKSLVPNSFLTRILRTFLEAVAHAFHKPSVFTSERFHGSNYGPCAFGNGSPSHGNLYGIFTEVGTSQFIKIMSSPKPISWVKRWTYLIGIGNIRLPVAVWVFGRGVAAHKKYVTHIWLSVV